MALEYWIVPHTHWDREWYLSFQDFRWKLVEAIDRAIDTLEGDARFEHFMLDGQTVALEDYLEIRPERRAALASLVAEGRLAVGPWYVQPDDILPSGEALARNLERGLALARSFGASMMVGYLPDSFGHSGSLPALLRGFGIDAACLMRGPGRAINRCLFHWRARDGSKVLVAFLIDGYNNGADLAAEGADIAVGLAELRARQESQGALVEGLPLLAMNGYDHRPIDAGLPALLESANLAGGGPGGDRAKIGSLEGYLDIARAVQDAADLPERQGELRSTYRSPITAGCVSTRHWIKQQDQEISSLLEGRAEPLAALAFWLGAAAWPAGALDAAWKQLLLNQAHDSICGCSIDRVHRDMAYRYAQARDLASNIAASSAAAIAGLVDSSKAGAEGRAILVLNPGPRRKGALAAIELPSLPPDPVIVDSESVARRVQAVAVNADSGGTPIFFDERFKPAQLKLALGLVRGGELMSYRITDAALSAESKGVLRVDLELSDARRASAFDWSAWLEKARLELESPGLSAVHAVGRRAGPVSLLFAADAPDFGAACYSLRSARPGERIEDPGMLAAGPRFLENEFYRLSVRGDGSVDLLDKASGARYSGLDALTDGGDRGDEYDYDRPPRDRLVEKPRRGFLGRGVKIRLVEPGPLRAAIRVEAAFLVPASLDADRRGRSSRMVELATRRVISLSAGSRRIEFRTEVDNCARDHRLRAGFPLPGRCAEAEVGGNFEIFRRSASPDLPGPGEEPYGPSSDTSREVPPTTHPFAGLVGAPWESDQDGACPRGGLVLMARGLREYEIAPREEGVFESELRLSLFRSVGWLSRGDLSSRSEHAGPDIPTPEAQELGTWAFEYAIATYDGGIAASGLAEEWADYRQPLEALAQAPHPGQQGERASLLSVEAESLAFSSLRRSRKGGLSLRFYDLLGKAREARIRVGVALSSAAKTRLDGEEPVSLELAEDRRSFLVHVEPYEIVTVEFERS